MKIMVDMDGVLLTTSEDIFSEILSERFGILIKEYVQKVLIKGEKITSKIDTSSMKSLFDAFLPKLTKYYDSDAGAKEINSNKRILGLLKKQGAELYLMSGSPEYIGNEIITRYDLTRSFSRICFAEEKLGDSAFYATYIEEIEKANRDEEIIIVEDSYYHVLNVAELARKKRNIKILFLLTPLYIRYYEDLNEIFETLRVFDNVFIIRNFYEMVSEIMPLVFDFRNYLPITKSSASGYDDLVHTTMLYRELYSNKCFYNFNRLDPDSYAWVEKREYFAIFGLFSTDENNNYTRILMKMDFGTGHVKWLLPGGSLRPKMGSNSNYIDILLKKIYSILMGETRIRIRNLIPVCNLTNIFSDGQSIHCHHGIGWMGFIVSSSDLLKELLRKIGEFENISVDILKIKENHIMQAPARNTFREIQHEPRCFKFEAEGSLNKIGRLFHRFAVKPAFSAFRRHKKYIRQKIEEANPFSLIDVSCGDDRDILYYMGNCDVRMVVLNDISPELTLEMKKFLNEKKHKFPKTDFLFSMQDATNFTRYREKIFDFVLCKNTLHHFPSIEIKERCLAQLKRISRKCILIMDVEYPKVEAEFLSFFWKKWVLFRHWYYMNVVGEAGAEDLDTAFLSFDDFRVLIERNFTEDIFTLDFTKIATARATYAVAFIVRKA